MCYKNATLFSFHIRNIYFKMIMHIQFSIQGEAIKTCKSQLTLIRKMFEDSCDNKNTTLLYNTNIRIHIQLFVPRSTFYWTHILLQI